MLRLLAVSLLALLPLAARTFRAGAAQVDITPSELPVIVNCYMTERAVGQIRARLSVKALVLDDGVNRLVIAVADSCMMPRELIDRAKSLAAERTRIDPARMLVSATHTHFAPAAMACLGSDAQPGYADFLASRIADAISAAAANLAPARIGWSSVDDPAHSFNRRWIYERGKELTDPFGVKSVRANMHPGYQNPAAIAPSGPVDSELSVLALQTRTGQPLAVLANYGMHYFNDQPVSNDYFGHFANSLAKRLGAESGFVGIMSQGTSGDLATLDYSRPAAATWTIEQYADGVAASAEKAYRAIRYHDWVALDSAEVKLRLRRRLADPERLQWARQMVATIGNRKPKNQPEIYAREQLMIAAEPERELRLQVLRIGGLAISAIPNEVFAITGLKLKAATPFAKTFNVELANGAEGYIPPPEQHLLGGYTTWAARTAGLETTAEPQIVESLLTLHEKLAGKPRRNLTPTLTAYRKSILALKPIAYFPLEDMAGDAAADFSRGRGATVQGGVARYLEGHSGRAMHFAGGTLTAQTTLPGDFTIDLWFWHGLKPVGDPRQGVILDAGGNRVAVARDGQLLVNGVSATLTVTAREWLRLTVSRQGDRLRCSLGGKMVAEAPAKPGAVTSVQFGGAGDPESGFEGKLDEIAIFARALDPANPARVKNEH